eukprot:scaffold217163_cov33-Tisochrysis_lutea.AAC.3
MAHGPRCDKIWNLRNKQGFEPARSERRVLAQRPRGGPGVSRTRKDLEPARCKQRALAQRPHRGLKV